MSAIHNLTHQIVDYAGLFPPAALPLENVVGNYASYIEGPYASMLARLILPVSKLDSFENEATFKRTKNIWRISCLIPGVTEGTDELRNAIQRIELFNSSHLGRAIIDTVEVKASDSNEIQLIAQNLSGSLAPFFELPHQQPIDECIATIRSLGDQNFAKIRTGGVTPELIPAPEQVAQFLQTCAKHDVGLKATAGLHHPLRGEFRLTYKEDAPIGCMFGYLNVFLAAMLAFDGVNDTGSICDLLKETDPGSFEFTDSSIRWRDHVWTAEEISRTRNKIISFGSCSFDEPTQELVDLGLMESASSIQN